MAAAAAVTAVFMVIVSTFGLIPSPTRAVPMSEDVDIPIALAAINNLSNYYKANVRNINLDGLYGLRVLEGKTKFPIF